MVGGRDLTGDGVVDLIVSAPSADEGGDQAGVVYVVAGPITGDMDLDDAAASWAGSHPYGELGLSVALPGDVDGDGAQDVLLGEPFATMDGTARTGRTAAWLVTGPATAGAFASAESWTGEDESATGRAVAGVGDIDGDGLADLGVGAWQCGVAGDNQGAAYVIPGADLSGKKLENLAVRLYGDNHVDTSTRSYLGGAVLGLGDMDGDGQDDLAVSAPAWSGNDAYYQGAIHVWYGPVTGPGFETDADFHIVGHEWAGYLGYTDFSVTAPGDLDGDGIADYAVGAFAIETTYVVTGGARTGEQDVFTAQATITAHDHDDFGWNVADAGDTDGDGRSDLVVTAPGSDEYVNQGGAVFLYTAPIVGALDDGDAAAAFYGLDAGKGLGSSVAAPGDVTGDGVADLVLGAWSATGLVPYSGAVFVVPGGT